MANGKTTRELTVEQHFAALLELLKDEPEPTVQHHFDRLRKMLDDWRERRRRKRPRTKRNKGACTDAQSPDPR